MDNKVINQLEDLKHLSWTKTRNSSGTAGSFLKSYDDYGSKKKYYKLSNYITDKGIVGHESINEIIVDRLLTILGIPHLSYNLIHSDVMIDGSIFNTYVCMSYDFKEKGEDKIALETFYQQERLPDDNMFNFCLRHGWQSYIYEMLVVDFLILNRDRHGANIEVLRNKNNKSYRLAPLFDHGLSLVFSCLDDDEVKNFDVLKDRRIQCCVGSNSAYDNLKLIPKDSFPKLNPLEEEDKEYLMYGLDEALNETYRNKIWEMIYNRWQIYESIRNQK